MLIGIRLYDESSIYCIQKQFLLLSSIVQNTIIRQQLIKAMDNNIV